MLINAVLNSSLDCGVYIIIQNTMIKKTNIQNFLSKVTTYNQKSKQLYPQLYNSQTNTSKSLIKTQQLTTNSKTLSFNIKY